jgi:hypothetical protein
MKRLTRMNVLLPRPLLLDVDLMSEQGRALQQSVADLYGSKIVEAATLARRMFLYVRPGRRDCVLSAQKQRPWSPAKILVP